MKQPHFLVDKQRQLDPNISNLFALMDVDSLFVGWYYHFQQLIKEQIMNINYPFKPLKKIRLYEEVADQIKKSIFDGYLKPGDSLPSERELSSMFSVGRPTVREALRTLDVLGLIETNPNQLGYVVREADITQYMDTLREQLAWLIHADKKTLRDLWEVRKFIELGISHTAACNATEQDLHDLDLMIEDMRTVVDDFDAYFPLASDFHKKLALISKNRIFYIIWSMIHDILLKGYTPILKDLFPEGPVRLYEVNKLIIEAIRSKDPDKIDKAMEIHSKAEDVFQPNQTK